jgi:hypothetical protein
MGFLGHEPGFCRKQGKIVSKALDKNVVIHYFTGE